MRTLKLTHEQIATIQEALGIAEKAYSDIHKQLSELNCVRNNTRKAEQKTDNMRVHDKSGSFADLNSDIEQSKLDI